MPPRPSSLMISYRPKRSIMNREPGCCPPPSRDNPGVAGGPKGSPSQAKCSTLRYLLGLVGNGEEEGVAADVKLREVLKLRQFHTLFVHKRAVSASQINQPRSDSLHLQGAMLSGYFRIIHDNICVGAPEHDSRLRNAEHLPFQRPADD